jgi:mono/diheme cytochrome c family protein
LNLKRLLIDRMENRILVGTTAFLASMVLIGWVAINEPGRMAAFQQQQLARSVEHGAELYANNCAECHGPSGLGSARAPGLNNPQLFGIDFLAPVNNDIAALQTARTDVVATQELLNGDTSSMSAEEIAGLEEKLNAYAERYGEDTLAAIDAQLAAKETERSSLLSQMQVAIDRGYDPEHPNRLNIVGWGGTLDAFVHTTLISGRPTSISYWPQPMPAWSRTAGGPLREDQLVNLTNYIMNWGSNRAWTVDDLLAVQQFAKIPSEGGGPAEEAVAPELANIPAAQVEANRERIDTEVARVLEELATVTGDPNNGQVLYTGSLACSACHNNASIAPPTEGTYTRTVETRLQDPAISDHTAQQYLVESILVPNAYIAPGYPANAMPQDFGARLDLQMLADLIAYLESHDEPDPLN